ncbi:MAG: hypothetical protein HC851_13950 [Acaryochloris sp. RU_4_1]|nr:hypothetical protein [Acaryochloris sp. RU_4_1]NJR56541.1 hypothetical protein [Acaryochloris sp. CRU_2_0]
MDWLSYFEPNHLLHLAQTTIAAASNVEVELLRQQLDFINSENARLSADFVKKLEVVSQANKDLSESFKTFVDTMKFVLTVFGAVGTVIAIVIAFVFGKNLEDAKKVARESIRQGVDSHVTTLVQAEVENIRRTLQRERVIGNTIVNYYLPNSLQPPREFTLLKARGFRDVHFPEDLQQLQSRMADVVVLDLENWLTTLLETRRDDAAKAQIDTLLTQLPRSTVLVVYIRRQLPYLYSVPKDHYITAANNPVTLIGMVADAAYVVVGDQRAESLPGQFTPQ